MATAVTEARSGPRYIRRMRYEWAESNIFRRLWFVNGNHGVGRRATKAGHNWMRGHALTGSCCATAATRVYKRRYFQYIVELLCLIILMNDDWRTVALTLVSSSFLPPSTFHRSPHLWHLAPPSFCASSGNFTSVTCLLFTSYNFIESRFNPSR